MGQKLRIDQNGGLTKNSSSQVQMNLGANSLILSTLGGQQYASSSVLLLNTGSTGAGGLDTGSVAASKIYFVHFVLSGSSLAIVASLSKTSVTGFSLFTFSGLSFTTDASANILAVGSLSSLRTITTLTSVSGTYTTPVGATLLRIKMVGGGGGGAGSGQSGMGVATAGSATTFGTLLTANGGSVGGIYASGGSGGTATISSGGVGFAIAGSAGGGGINQSASNLAPSGGIGGCSPFGGSGAGGGSGTNSGAGGVATVNTGSGGGGAGALQNTGVASGSGGGSGGYIEAVISNPSSSYSYTIGTGGSGGTAGTNGAAGGAGGSGVIIIEEVYA
jgi:hypothetical protein